MSHHLSVPLGNVESAQDFHARSPLVGDDCMDAGGRATHGAVVEGWGEGKNKSLLHAFVTLLLPLTILFACFSSTAHADGPTVAASHVWIRAAPPGVNVMAGYLTLGNLSGQALILVSVASPDFDSVMVHRSVQKNGMDSMKPVANLAIPARQSVTFAPGGYHLMLMKPVKQLYDGDLVTLTLTFSDHSSLTIMAPVRRDQPQH